MDLDRHYFCEKIEVMDGKVEKPRSIKILQWVYLSLSLLFLFIGQRNTTLWFMTESTKSSLVAMLGLVAGFELMVVFLASFFYSIKSLRIGYYLSISLILISLVLTFIPLSLGPEYKSGDAGSLFYFFLFFVPLVSVFLPLLIVNGLAFFFLRKALKSLR